MRVFIEDGTVVYADEGTIGETLGRILVREKVLTDAQYNAALERMEVLTKKGAKAKLGEILIDLGFVTPVQLDAALSAQVRQKVIRAIGWGVSTFRFFECHGGALDIAARFATPLEPLVLAALRLAPEEHVEELLDLALTRYPELRGDGTPTGGPPRRDTLRRVAAFELEPEEHDFALSLDGSRTSADILASTSEVNPTVVLSLLLLTDCLDLHASARPARAAAASASEKLRPLRRITPAAGQKAIRPIARKKAPSSVRPPAPADIEQTRSVAARLRQASEAKKSPPPPGPGPSQNERTTTPPPPPAPPPAPPSAEKVGELALWAGDPSPSTPMAPVNRILAEKAFQAGKAFLRANNMKDAASELARAATLFPAIEYELWASWTAMRADKTAEARHVPAVKALAEKAIEQDPSLGFAYFVLGHLALRSFDAARARELFAKARALDPATTSEAKDVRLKNAEPNASTETPADPPAQSKAEAGEAVDAAPPPSKKKPAATALDDEPPNSRPSGTEAPAVEADAPTSSRGAPKPMPRRNMLVFAFAGAVLATVIAVAATRKNEGATTPAASASSPSAAVVPPPAVSSVSSVSAASASASADPNAISLDEDEDASPAPSAVPDAPEKKAASAPDTKAAVTIFPDASAPANVPVNDE